MASEQSLPLVDLLLTTYCEDQTDYLVMVRPIQMNLEYAAVWLQLTPLCLLSNMVRRFEKLSWPQCSRFCATVGRPSVDNLLRGPDWLLSDVVAQPYDV